MGGFFNAIAGLFGGENRIRIVPLYSLRHELISWRQSGHYPDYYHLPPGISFDTKFWERVKEIYRHTTTDKHERAVSVWYVDGEFVLTEQVRGSDSRVTIPGQRVQISYKPVKGTNYGDRVIMFDGKGYAKRSVDIATIRQKSKQKLEVSHLFHMHTHPPRERQDGSGTARYSFFSHTDIKSFVGSKAAFAGLITDRLWLIAKTSETVSAYKGEESSALTPEVLTNKYKIKVYTAEFGRSAVLVRPDIESSSSGESPA